VPDADLFEMGKQFSGMGVYAIGASANQFVPSISAVAQPDSERLSNTDSGKIMQ